jgi:hypothetical protein
MKRILLAILIGIGIPALMMPFIEQGLRRFDIHKYQKLDEIIEGKSPYTHVFFGSSRTYLHYHPGVLDTMLQASCFNAGTEGALYGETDVLLRQYLLKHPAPKVIIVNIDLAMFVQHDRIFNPSSYYPYLHERIISEYLHRQDPFSRGISWLPFLAMTRYDDYMRGNALKGMLGKTAPYSGYHYKGYIEAPGLPTLNPDKGLVSVARDTLRADAFMYFKQWNQICKASGVKFLAVFSPYHESFYRAYPWHVEYKAKILGQMRQYGIELIDFQSSPMAKDAKRYSDVIHLNRNGAREFSMMLADSLKARAY